MKLLALFLACLFWLIFLCSLQIQLKLFYRFRSLESKIVAELRILFSHINIEVNIPKEMISLGFTNMFNNIINDVTEEECTDEKIETPPKTKTKVHRYKKVKHYYRELFRHYVTSWSKIIWLKRGLHKIKVFFFSKINIYSINASIEIGGRDAAETGLLVGALWAFFGQMTAKLYRMFIVKKNDIRYNVVPRFDDETFLCKLNCILSLKISHIIFTVYKFLIFILKNRRIRNYG